MNFVSLFKAFDTVMALRDAARRIRHTPAADAPVPSSETPATAQPIEARLTGVVVAALKEAFDRDHARLELERYQLEDQKRRAEEALRLELRRLAVDRELLRLRLLAATALAGWIASIVAVSIGPATASAALKIAIGAGWLLLLSAFAAAFIAQERVNARAADGNDPPVAAAAPLWLLLSGLATIAASVLFR